MATVYSTENIVLVTTDVGSNDDLVVQAATTVIKAGQNSPAPGAILTGMQGGSDGRLIGIWNISALGAVSISGEDTGSAAANRFKAGALPNGVAYSIPPFHTAWFVYMGGFQQRWVLVGVSS